MIFSFKELRTGPSWRTIRSGFPRRSAGEAWARDWLAAEGFELVMLEHDNPHAAIDMIAQKGDELFQFAVERST